MGGEKCERSPDLNLRDYKSRNCIEG